MVPIRDARLLMLATSTALRSAALLVVAALLAVACQTTTAISPSTATTPSSQALPDPTEVVVPTSTPSPVATEIAPPPTATTPTEDPTPAATPTQVATPAPVVTPTPIATPAPEAATVDDLLLLSSLRSVECPTDVAGDRVTCSVATLPLNVDAPVPGETVEIMVALVDNGDPNGIGPVVFLQGGPGVGSINQAKAFAGAAHDVMFVDQRGTGYSSPKLDCPEIDALWEAQFSNDPNVRLVSDVPLVAAYAECGERLAAAGIDFDHFNTRSAAVDIELLRRLFLYDQWSIWGISYGTRLGLTILRDHPDGVRAAVLDSLVPFEVDFFATIPENVMRAIRALDSACDGEQCAADHGDFLTTLSELVIELDRNPAVVTATRPITGEQFPFRVDGSQLLDLVFTQLYSTRALESLPRQIARAEFGGLDEIVASFVLRRDPTQFDLSVGLYYATWCREEFPFYDASTDDALLQSFEPAFGSAVAEALSSDGVERFCDIFEVEPAPAYEDLPISSAIPTLVFAGAFDPITPPAWSQQVAAAMSNSIYVEMANHGHGMATACPVNIRIAFLTDPEAALDTSCADQTGGPEFE